MDVQLPSQHSSSGGISINDKVALEKIRTFSILSIAGYVLDFLLIILSIIVLVKFDSYVVSRPPGTAGFSILGFAPVYLLVTIILTSVLFIVSLAFLRSAFGLLKSSSSKFDSPYMGTAMFFIGLGLMLLGAVLFLAFITTNSAGLIIGGLVVIVIGGILGFVGTILAFIIGSFRLKDHFNSSKFGTAGTLFIVGIFLSPINIAGVVLLYSESSSLLKNSSPL
jgi:hypothetical protein